MQHIYLLQEREFLLHNQEVYKIGKTKQENLSRIKSYPKGSNLLLYRNCKNCDRDERELLKIFRHKFKSRTDIGSEYFEGNVSEMIECINKYLKSEEEANRSTDELNCPEENYFYCQVCDYSTSRKDTFQRHLLTGKHGSSNNRTPSENVYSCDACKYMTTRKDVYQLHLQTPKHISTVAKPGQYQCSKCQKRYETRSGLWKHSNTCTVTVPLVQNTNVDSIMIASQFIEIIKQREEATERELKLREEALKKELLLKEESLKRQLLLREQSQKKQLLIQSQATRTKIVNEIKEEKKEDTSENKECAIKFYCPTCDYLTNLKDSYNRHMLCSKHINKKENGSFIVKLNNKFVCKSCEYETIRKDLIQKHIKTKKHMENENGYNQTISITLEENFEENF